MAQIKTAHCKNFLAEFFSNNPQIVNALLSGTDPKELNRIQTWTWQANCWKRTHRCKPANSDYCLGYYKVYRDGVVVNSHAEPSPVKTIGTDEVAWERGFVCNQDKLEDTIKFLVLETKGGDLLLGDYVGD